MLKWLMGGRTEAKAPAKDAEPRAPKLALDLAKLAEQDLVIVFKHSTTCPVSWAANREMQTFMARHPEVLVRKVLVREERDLSEQIAAWTGIRHESPQVIVLRKGAVAASASHGEVTEDYLAEAVAG